MLRVLREVLVALVLTAVASAATAADPNDREGSKDPPIFTRMPGFHIDRADVIDFDRVEFAVARGKSEFVRISWAEATDIVRDLLALEPSGRGTDIAGALRFAHRVLHRRSIVAVVSDFQNQGYERALGLLRSRHDVVAFHLLDPLETALPAAGLVALKDPETGDDVVADTSDPAVRSLLATSVIADAAGIFKRTRVDSLSLSTAESYERPLTGFFRRREKRR